MRNLVAIAFFALTFGCQSGDGSNFIDTDPSTSPSTNNTEEFPFELRLEPADSNLPRLETAQLAVQAYDRDGEPIATPLDEVAWTHDRFVDHRGEGEFFGVDVGVAVVEATFRGISERATITVTPQRVGTIELLPSRRVVIAETESLTYGYRLFGVDGQLHASPEEVDVTFSTADPDVAIAAPNGEVTGVGPGTTDVVAEAQGVTATARLEVFALEATIFRIFGLQDRLLPGSYRNIEVLEEWSPRPPANYSLTIESSDENVIQTTDFAEIVARAEGTATITVSVTGLPDVRDTAEVRVTNDVSDFALSGTRLLVLIEGQIWEYYQGFSGPSYSTVSVELDEYDSLDAGLLHVCMHNATDLTVACQGNSNLGQAGLPSGSVFNPRYLPEMDVESVTASGLRSCFVRAGQTLCWGQIGADGDSATHIPAPVDYTAFAQTEGHTCEVGAAGLACYGANDEGQLGLGTRTPLGAGAVVTTETFVELVAGESFTCGRTADGRAFCWGDGDLGQLGDGLFDDASTPRLVSGGHTFTALAAGSSHVCGLDDGARAWCWGANDQGQLGDGTIDQRGVPTAIDTARRFTKIDTAGNLSCALEAFDHDVWCWGSYPANTALPTPLPASIPPFEDF